jgi:putative glutamine transport system permease protein
MIVELWNTLLDLLPGDWELFKEWPFWRFLLLGLWLSAKIAGFAIVLSLIIGVLMSVARLAPLRPVRWAAATYVETFRATPLLLLMFFVFFGAGRVDASWLLNFPGGSSVVDDVGNLQPMPSAIVALTLYNSAVVAEIMRAGILSISRGIIEAGRALGLTYLQTMWHIAIPMTLRRMAPGIVSQLVTLFKDTSLASTISIEELLRRGRLIYETPRYSNAIEVLTVVALMYFIPCYILSLIAQRLEQSPDDRRGRGLRDRFAFLRGPRDA